MSVSRSITLLGVLAVIVVGVGLLIVRTGPDRAPEPWKKLRYGMSKPEVIELLGEPFTRSGPSTTTVFGLSFSRKEFWQYYGGSWLPLLGPSDDPYVIYFYADGNVASMRRPKREKHL